MSKNTKRKNDTKKTGATTLRKKVKNILQEIIGVVPYERTILNFLKIGKEKKAIKYAKKRLGNIKRAKNKIEYLNNLTKFN
jgi:large subunit ribosomal protein L36e